MPLIGMYKDYERALEVSFSHVMLASGSYDPGVQEAFWVEDLSLEFISRYLHLCHETNKVPPPKFRHISHFYRQEG